MDIGRRCWVRWSFGAIPCHFINQIILHFLSQTVVTQSFTPTIYSSYISNWPCSTKDPHPSFVCTAEQSQIEKNVNSFFSPMKRQLSFPPPLYIGLGIATTHRSLLIDLTESLIDDYKKPFFSLEALLFFLLFIKKLWNRSRIISSGQCCHEKQLRYRILYSQRRPAKWTTRI